MRQNYCLGVTLVVAGLSLTGCATVPDFDSARDEVRDDMQTIVDLLPAGSVDHVEDPIPRGFVSCDGGGMYTGRWLVYLDDPRRVGVEVAALRVAAASEGYVEDAKLESDDQLFRVRQPTDPEGVLVSVGQYEDLGGTPYIEIMGFARCSQKPEGVE
ncbi:hypothetical protein [Agromyces lapidis]|uniref:Lipoprotein n=1 Tax=Agromyces lapidis TaxID=279574 RepID=A0ABV5SNA8_9MICO|nr:hypothetical protein [Agromyces lapidis]